MTEHERQRQPLAAMSPAELAAWLAHHQAELETFCTYVQAYVLRREGRAISTQTDMRYRQFLREARDLLAGLSELRQLAENAAREQERGLDNG